MLLRPINFLVLDEPTNHLDILSKEMLKQAILDFEGTLLVVSHDREFLSELTTRTIEFRDHHLYEYLGDINYFLEKRKLDNMRQVEMRSNKASSAPAAVVKTAEPLSPEERKLLQRNVQKLERRIEELEAEIKNMEAVMADPDFYGRSDADSTLQKYQGKQKELAEVMVNWESMVEQSGF
jgi:ATP-binding cassette subfamily F protein 3